MTTLPLESGSMSSEEEMEAKEAIREQLERILEHSAFRGSMRSARFLRYVVEYWIDEDHHGEPLKERALGAALFGLHPAYDTNQNSVVRNAAVDVRRRLMLYYLEPDHENEIQIAMPAGSYVPHIDFPARMQLETDRPAEESEVSPDEESGAPAELVPTFPLPRGTSLWQRNGAFFSLLFMVVIVLAAGVSVLGWQRWNSRDNGMPNMRVLDLFWQPVLDASSYSPVILVCVEQLPPIAGVDQAVMPVGDAIATANFARLLSLKDKKFHIAVANEVTADDLQASTVVMVGGIDNPWTTYLTDELRFHFSSQITANSPKVVWIEDRRNPSQRNWSLAAPRPASGEMMDFAIVARVKDTRTGLWRVVASGLDGVGTSVASRLLVDSNYTKELTARLPKGWTSKNIEVVIAFKVVNNKVDYPHVVDYEVW